MKLTPAWFILLYHNVSWEEGPLLWHIGGTCPPDIHRDHVKAAQDLGRAVSVRDGYERFTSECIDEPSIGFWFDESLCGVSLYAVDPRQTWHNGGDKHLLSICRAQRNVLAIQALLFAFQWRHA